MYQYLLGKVSTRMTKITTQAELGYQYLLGKVSTLLIFKPPKGGKSINIY